MTARVLVVDDVLANVRLLEAKLAAEYFDVVTAMNGADALEAVQRCKPDIVLLDVMMPGIDGIEVCRRIKSTPATQHVPVVMVTALDQPEDRVKGLEAGADDFLTKPVNDVAMFCRVKSLVRLKMLTDELANRTGSDPLRLLSVELAELQSRPGNILVIDNRTASADRLATMLGARHEVTLAGGAEEALDAFAARPGGFELVIVSLDMQHVDALRICSQLKSYEPTRQTPVLIIADPEDNQRLLRALDLGVNDYLMRPVDRQELHARVSTQLRRYRYTDLLRTSVRASIEMAVTDPLTGLHNRRYLETHLGHVVEQALSRSKPVSVLVLDIDFFKSVNDTYGHNAGDRVLQEVAARLKGCVRGSDLACRSGGEEFVVVLPGADAHTAERVGERIRKTMAAKPFLAAPGCHLPITVSVGASGLTGTEDTVQELLKRADRALYRSKREGRNRVSLSAA